MPSRKRREVSLRHFFRTRSGAMRALLETVGKVLDHDVSILILGESGSGKDYLAEAIHACGSRRGEPLVAIDCASIPSELFESELFGYEKGSFTDATSRKLGKLELAQRGTLYFDEITALTTNLQAKLLRAIQDRSFTRLGGHEAVGLDVRIISSSNGEVGALRRDLLYRINVVTLTLPPLRERREDIPQLARQFLRNTSPRVRAIDDEAMRMLRDHSWPGNLRELRNVIERAAVVEESDRITAASLPTAGFSGGDELVATAVHDLWTLDELESRYIREILRQTRSNYSRAAQVLGINRKTLLEKRRKYGIE